MGKSKRRVNEKELGKTLEALRFTLNQSAGPVDADYSNPSFLGGLHRHQKFLRDHKMISNSPGYERSQFRRLSFFLNRKYPKLMFGNNVKAMACLCLSEWIRPLEEWKPKGKSQERMLRGLATHLHCKYPTPEFLFPWFTPRRPYEFNRQIVTSVRGRGGPTISGISINLFFYLAHGGSMRKAQERGVLNLPMTKKMAHIFMTTKAKYSIIEALRRAETLGLGYDQTVFDKVLGIPDYNEIGNLRDEAFRRNYLQWLGNHPMLAQEQAAPLFDYAKHRRAEDRNFILTGRSPMAMLQSMEQWHAEQYHDYYNWGNKNREFKPSGIIPATWSKTEKLKGGAEYEQIWAIQELLTDKELRKEGRAMHHCVGSYGDSIERGNCSIWSLRCLDPTDTTKRIATIEVRASRIVQVCGPCNAKTEKSHLKAIDKWAGKNNLTTAKWL